MEKDLLSFPRIDVAAIPRSGGSGHVGIYVEDRGYFKSSVMAANEMGVGWSSSHLRNNYVKKIMDTHATNLEIRFALVG